MSLTFSTRSLTLFVPLLLASQLAGQTTSSSASAGRDPQGTLTFSEKAGRYVHTTASLGVVANAALSAALVMADPPSRYPREWSDGGGAFGRNFGNRLAQNVTVNTTQFLVGGIVGEDPRYFPSHSHNALVRFGHALAFTLVDRGDNGKLRPAIANYAGAAAGGFLPKVYMPRGFDDDVHSEQRALVQFGFIGAQNVLHEFSPELKAVGRKLHLPGSR